MALPKRNSKGQFVKARRAPTRKSARRGPAKSRRSPARRKASSKALKVVPLATVMSLIKKAEKRIAVRAKPKPKSRRKARKNPLTHFPRLPGRGRPEKVYTWDVVTKRKDGAIAERTIRTTKKKAFLGAKRTAARKDIAEVVIDNRR